jgi:hypothetical protein
VFRVKELSQARNQHEARKVWVYIGKLEGAAKQATVNS